MLLALFAASTMAFAATQFEAKFDSMLAACSLSPRAIEAAQGFTRQALHAAVLGFDHPVSGAALRFESPVPTDMAALIAALRGEA